MTSEKSLTPMMAQYKEIKAQYPGTILFYRLGDFYEMFFEDAVEVSHLLQLTLTARNKGEHKAPMCGIPYHASQGYIAKLTRLGKKVAICEQLSDPTLPGIVKRDVVRVITPGTTLDEHVLDQKSNNFVMSFVEKDGRFGVAVADLSTGLFQVTECDDMKSFLTEFERLQPTEAVVEAGSDTKSLREVEASRRSFSTFFFEHNFHSDPTALLVGHFRVQSLAGFGLEQTPLATRAAAILLDYLQTTQKTDLTHFQGIQLYNSSTFMPLDEATIKNLEIMSTLRENDKKGSLLWVLDETITSMGGRYLRHVLTHPLLEQSLIQERLDAVDELLRNPSALEDVRGSLSNVLDLERLLARLSLGHGNARDLLALKNSLKCIPTTRNLVVNFSSQLVRDIASRLHDLPDLVNLLERALVDEPPLAVREGGMIREGFNNELDDIKHMSREGKGYIQSLQEKEVARTGINSLKIRYNSVFGYYIEISKANLHAAPQDYIRKQTLVNAERFITPELKEYEEKVLRAEEKIVVLEYKIFNELREKIVQEVVVIQELAVALAKLDVLCSFAQVALINSYCKPQVTSENVIRIMAGRHPVVEKMSFSSQFISNDVGFDDSQKLMLITGPNMGGKSTFLRQTALIVLMAHLGSFVPAKEATIGLVDRIFTRVGASDNLVRGQSTFMVEMQETAYILSHATAKSLVILDEIGRGTSTYDGMSIAWAITEYIHDRIGAKTLFATHYHELISLADKLPYAKNYSVAVRENAAEGVIFLYKIVEGGVDRSYGIEVAKLAGLPFEVTQKAKMILVDLEEGVLEQGIEKELTDTTKRIPASQKSLFTETDIPANRLHQDIQQVPSSAVKNPALEQLESIDLNQMTPIEALNTLVEMKKSLL